VVALRMNLQCVWSAANSLVSKEPVAPKLIGMAGGRNTSAYSML